MADVKITNPDKVLFPRDSYTKADVISYYRSVSDVMLPFLRNHPTAMLRFNAGIDGERFFHKNAPDYFPDFIDRADLPTSKRTTKMPVVNNIDALTYIANHNCIEFHVLPMLADSLWPTDRMVRDFDPDTETFDGVRQAARWARELLDDVGLTPYVMTSGSRGLHIWVPVSKESTVEEVHDLSGLVADVLVSRYPDVLTREFHRVERGDRIYVDIARNGPGQHAVAPYSLRAKDRAPVATPITWDEVDDDSLTPLRYALADVPALIEKRDDPWKGIHRKRPSIAKPRSRLEQLVAS
jgi:bifunctional non-homologous end joining protein LigD